MRIVLSTLSIVFSLSSYHICNYFYESDIDKWYDLKAILNSLSFILLYQSLFYETNKFGIFLTTIYCGIFIEDLTDRLFFNIDQYEWNDLLSIFITILIAIYNYKNDK